MLRQPPQRGGHGLQRFGLDQPFTVLQEERVHAPVGGVNGESVKRQKADPKARPCVSKDQREQSAFPADQHHSAGQHHQDQRAWFRDRSDVNGGQERAGKDSAAVGGNSAPINIEVCHLARVECRPSRPVGGQCPTDRLVGC